MNADETAEGGTSESESSDMVYDIRPFCRRFRGSPVVAMASIFVKEGDLLTCLTGEKAASSSDAVVDLDSLILGLRFVGLVVVDGIVFAGVQSCSLSAGFQERRVLEVLVHKLCIEGVHGNWTDQVFGRRKENMHDRLSDSVRVILLCSQ